MGYDPCKCQREHKENESPYVTGTMKGDYSMYKQSFGRTFSSAKDLDNHLKEKGMVLADESIRRREGKIQRKDYNWDAIGRELFQK